MMNEATNTKSIGGWLMARRWSGAFLFSFAVSAILDDAIPVSTLFIAIWPFVSEGGMIATTDSIVLLRGLTPDWLKDVLMAAWMTTGGMGMGTFVFRWTRRNDNAIRRDDPIIGTNLPPNSLRDGK